MLPGDARAFKPSMLQHLPCQHATKPALSPAQLTFTGCQSCQTWLLVGPRPSVPTHHARQERRKEPQWSGPHRATFAVVSFSEEAVQARKTALAVEQVGPLCSCLCGGVASSWRRRVERGAGQSRQSTVKQAAAAQQAACSLLHWGTA